MSWNLGGIGEEGDVLSGGGGNGNRLPVVSCPRHSESYHDLLYEMLLTPCRFNAL